MTEAIDSSPARTMSDILAERLWLAAAPSRGTTWERQSRTTKSYWGRAADEALRQMEWRSLHPDATVLAPDDWKPEG